MVWKHVGSFSAKVVKNIKDLGGKLAETLLGDGGDGGDGKRGSDRDEDEEEDEPTKETAQEKWEKLHNDATKLVPRQVEGKQGRSFVDQCEVGFAHLHFSGRASEGEVKVSLLRRGQCQQPLEVQLRPLVSQVEEADGVAVNGQDYFFEDTLVSFGASEMTAEVTIKLMEPKRYKTTQYFEVELYGVSKGDAVIGGPTVGFETHKSRKARVYISYDYAFPYNIPEQKRNSRLWVMWYYLQERRHSRGWHWWKTLLGLLYDPIHAVCVTAVLQKIVLDQICDPSVGGNKPLELFAVGLGQFASTALLRWGDKVATENRGRTGGTRMVHRQQLFAKLLMLDAEELGRVKGHWWFYVGVNNVDLMAKDAYYQGFMVIQSAFGLALSIIMLLYVQLSKTLEEEVEFGEGLAEAMALLAMPGISQIVMVILSFTLLWRNTRLGELLRKRMAGEAAWVDSLSWLCHAGLPLKSLASRIRARVDLRFSNESNYFVTYHKAARDWANDTLWCVKWLVNLAWIVVLVLGAKYLLEARESGSQIFQTGDFVFQLKVFSSFGKYLVRIVSSLIKMYTASVGLQEFAEMMNWPERSLSTTEGKILHDTSEEIIFEQLLLPAAGEKSRELMVAVPSERVVHNDLRIELGRVSRVTSQRERTLESFMYQVSELKAPQEGRVRRPQGIRIAFVPAIALHTPHATVLEELRADHHTEGMAEEFAQLFQLDPQTKLSDLQVGQRQSIAIVLAMFRNPEVLVLDRPLAFLTSRQRQKMLILLSLWQAGGIDALLQSLTGSELCIGDRRPRTLITSSEALDSNELPSSLFKDIHTIDLDATMGPEQARCTFWSDMGLKLWPAEEAVQL